MKSLSLLDSNVPDWACFFDPPRYAAFLAAVQRDLHRRGHRVSVDDGIARLRLDDGRERRFGLQNLAQVCNQSSEQEWAEIIREHFDGVIRTSEDPRLEVLARDFERARQVLKVRLYPTEAVADSTSALIQKPVAEGLAAVLTYDLPDVVATVPREDLSRWPLDVDEAFELGLQNVLAEPEGEHERVELDEGGVFTAVVSESFFVTSWLLMLDRLIAPASEFGAVVAVPNRHTLLWGPVHDLSVLETVGALMLIAERRFADGPGSLSPRVYWWRDGKMETLPGHFDEGQLQLTPSRAFVEKCLRKLPRHVPSGFGTN